LCPDAIIGEKRKGSHSATESVRTCANYWCFGQCSYVHISGSEKALVNIVQNHTRNKFLLDQFTNRHIYTIHNAWNAIHEGPGCYGTDRNINLNFKTWIWFCHSENFSLFNLLQDIGCYNDYKLRYLVRDKVDIPFRVSFRVVSQASNSFWRLSTFSSTICRALSTPRRSPAESGSSLVQSSPVQSSPVQSSPVQSSPVWPIIYIIQFYHY